MSLAHTLIPVTDQANLPQDVVDRLDASDPTLLMGIYYGWARVVPRADRQLSSGDDDGDADRVDSRVFPMVIIWALSQLYCHKTYQPRSPGHEHWLEPLLQKSTSIR